MKTLKNLYEFYLEYCVDESKNEIPLSYLEWKLNHGEEECDKHFDPIMENNKKILNESISNKRREVSNKRKK